jgi:hypothetical protein
VALLAIALAFPVPRTSPTGRAPLPLTTHHNSINTPSTDTLSRPASVPPFSAQLLACVLASAVTWDPQQRRLLTRQPLLLLRGSRPTVFNLRDSGS